MNPIDRESVVVVVPTYNEAESLPLTLRRLRRAEAAVHVLVVDDSSPDGTGELADRLASEDSRVHVLHRRGKDGLGPAYLAGFSWALDRGFEVICEMDADGSHHPEELQRLLAGIDDGADFVVGSRWVRGGATVGWPWYRQLLSRAGSAYSRLALGLKVHDVTGGYRAIRATGLRQLTLHEVESAGYCFQVDLLRRADRCGLVIGEVPITFSERELGESKISGNIVMEALVRISLWGFRERVWRRSGARSTPHVRA